MSNPYAPKRTRVIGEVIDARAAFCERLRRLGAPADVVQGAFDHWHDVEDPADLAERDAAVAMTDDELREAIRYVIDEFAAATTTEPEQADVEMAAVLSHLAAAQERIGLSVPQLVDWIGDNRARAVAVWVAEHDSGHEMRKTLVSAIEAVAGDWLDRADLARPSVPA